MDAISVDERLEAVAASFGTPSYVYFSEVIEKRVSEVRSAFGDRFELSFAVKSNPNPAVLEVLKGQVAFLDVSSIGEWRLARQAGYEPERISFTGPGKRDPEIQEAIEGGIGELVVESVAEARAASRIAVSLGRVQNVLVRIAPAKVPRGFGDQMAGRPSPFGIDLETVSVELRELLALPNLRFAGLHIYSGTQCLSADAICENYRSFIGIFRELCHTYALRPDKLVFGSGLGIPYHDTDTALNLGAIADEMAGDLDALRKDELFANTTFALELGRYLVGEAGYFLTRVIRIKDSRGSRIAICDGGLNNHLPASGHFGMVIHRNYTMHRVGGGTPTQPVDVVGPLCTSIDKLAKGVMLPTLGEGDVIAVHNSGAYGLTVSPMHFISHSPPREILVDTSGLRDVTRIFGLA